MLILGIESSCDETAGAVCKDGKIISNVVLSQEIHNKFGGVVPEIASREHDSVINSIILQTLDEAHLKFPDINGIAVTYGAGLMGFISVMPHSPTFLLCFRFCLVRVSHMR